MLFKKLTSFLALVLVVVAIYFRDHFYILVIGLFLFLAYKFDLHNKLFRWVDKVSGRTKVVMKDKKRKNRYLKKMFKSGGSEI